tara:strand:+ start:1623 stop:2240 length:618 start_codon:yes stop_codon:yes gene_type:complete
VVGPEVRAVEGESSSGEGYGGDVFDFGVRAAEVDSSEEVVVGLFVVCGDEVDTVADEYLSGDAVWGGYGAFDLSALAEGVYLFIVPLADVEFCAVEAELGAGVVWAREFEFCVEAVARDETPNDAIIFVRFAAEDAKFFVAEGDAEGIAGGFNFPNNLPCVRVDFVDDFGFEGSHPEVGAVPCDGLWHWGGGFESFEFLDIVHWD